VVEVIRAAVGLQALCEAQGWRFCFIGGLALQRWGEPRETVDVDLTLLTTFGREEIFIDILLSRYEARIPNARDYALVRRVLVLRNEAGVGLDIALGVLPFEELAVARSSPFEFLENATIRTCSAEDLIIMKSFASRPKDWIDVEGILLRRHALDWPYIESQLVPLAELKETPEIWSELQRRRRDAEA
jgi:hypothetical protein